MERVHKNDSTLMNQSSQSPNVNQPRKINSKDNVSQICSIYIEYIVFFGIIMFSRVIYCFCNYFLAGQLML